VVTGVPAMMGGRLEAPGVPLSAESPPPPQAASVSIEIASKTICLPQLRMVGPINCRICIPKRLAAVIAG
jgi:hypothetical protein